MRVLINHSNHPSIKWDDKQKEGWDKIIDIPFPAILSHADTDEVLSLAKENCKRISWAISKHKKDEVYIYIEEECDYCEKEETYCQFLLDLLKEYCPSIEIVMPFRAGLTIDVIQGDNFIDRWGKFEFVGWRVISS